MTNNFNLLYEKFLEIKELGWIKSYRRGYTGIGYTFERLLGKDEDALCRPDFLDIEIKTHRRGSQSYVALFNYNPKGESSYELKRLFSRYSYLHTKNKNIRALNADVYCNYIKDVGINYKFSLEVDEKDRKIYLLVFDRLGYFIEKKSYWDFDVIEAKLCNKIKNLAFVEADSKFINGCEYFRYNKISFYTLKSFDTFIQLIKHSKIRVSFLVSGQSNDKESINSHGACFSIKKDNLHLLFRPVE